MLQAVNDVIAELQTLRIDDISDALLQTDVGWKQVEIDLDELTIPRQLSVA
jgi:hypothetical protein